MYLFYFEIRLYKHGLHEFAQNFDEYFKFAKLISQIELVQIRVISICILSLKSALDTFF